MRAHTPQGEPPGNLRRTSLGSNHLRASASGLPRPQMSIRDSRMSSMRTSNTQPSYNLFTGEASATPQVAAGQSFSGNPQARSGTVDSRESSKENVAPPDAEEYETQRRRIEELKAEIATMRYAMRHHEQEKEMLNLEKDNEIREVRRRADDDFKRSQAAEAEKARAERQVDTLNTDLGTLRMEKDELRKVLEKRARDAEEDARTLNEQLEDLNAANGDAARLAEKEAKDLRGQVETLQRTARELEQDALNARGALQKSQDQLVEKDEVAARLESEILRLKAQTGDADTIAVIRRELTDQVAHMRSLEAANLEQLTELKHLRQMRKAVEVVDEEKRSLQRKLDAVSVVETELAEEKRQRQRLEDDRRSWTAYLQSETDGSNVAEFDSPESMARALIQERLNSAALVEKLGEMQPEISDRDNIIKVLEKNKSDLTDQIDKLKTTSTLTSIDKARVRLDRQRALAVKEVEYLRAQLKTFDAEDITYQPENFDQKKSDRILELEELVDKYKEEVQHLHAELSSIERSSASPAQPPLAIAGSKRGHTDDTQSHEQLGQLARKNRKLQEELSNAQTALRLSQKEQAVNTEQLASAKEQLRTRVLALRSNPTSDFEAVKTATLAALRRENDELLRHVQQQPTLFATVPASQIAAAQREAADARAETAAAQKSARRLKEVWAAKSAEFKEAVFSTLGWTVTFIPNGKMRVESVYYPSASDEHENSIVFDGEKGTMKVGGGPRSAFAQKIADNIKFWVRERGCVPCFLAALTLEFYEEHTRAAKAS